MYHLVTRVDGEGNFRSACGAKVEARAGNVNGRPCTACVFMTLEDQDLAADTTALVVSQA